MSLPAGDPRHGTTGGYTNWGCRCAECREANTTKHREWRHRTGYSEPRAAVSERRRAAAWARDNHGTETRYRLGCRCDECRRGQNAARAARRKRPNVAVHGLNSSYSNGCRCAACRDAHRVYTNDLRARKKAAA